MSGKRIVGLVCLVLAVALLSSGVVTVSRGPDNAAPSGLVVSREVGAFLPGVLVLMVVVWLLQKPKGG